MDDLMKLADAGVVGVALALVIAIIFTIREFIKFIRNHIQHTNNYINQNTQVIQKLTDAISDLRYLLRKELNKK